MPPTLVSHQRPYGQSLKRGSHPAPLQCLWASLCRLWASLGCLRASFGHLWASLGHLRASLGCLWASPGRLRAAFGGWGSAPGPCRRMVRIKKKQQLGEKSWMGNRTTLVILFIYSFAHSTHASWDP